MSDATAGKAAFYEGDGPIFTPLTPSQSPWDTRNQNGVAISGLLMHLAEQVEAPGPMLAAHMTVDLLRPTPFAPVEGLATVVRAGRQVQIIETTLTAGGEVTARGRLLRVRQIESPAFPHFETPARHPAPDELGDRPGLQRSAVAAVVETRHVSGGSGLEGGGVIWTRVQGELVAGTPVSGLVQAAMISDFGNGISNPSDRSRWMSPNLDISLHMSRTPVGPWMLVDAHTVLDGGGVGLVNIILADQSGPFGRAHQILFVNPKPGA